MAEERSSIRFPLVIQSDNYGVGFSGTNRLVKNTPTFFNVLVHNLLNEGGVFYSRYIRGDHVSIAVKQVLIPNKLERHETFHGYVNIKLHELDRLNGSKILATFPFTPLNSTDPYTKFEETTPYYYPLSSNTFPFFLNFTVEGSNGEKILLTNDLPLVLDCELKLRDYKCVEMENYQVICSSAPSTMFPGNKISDFQLSLPPDLQQKNLTKYKVSVGSIIFPQEIHQEQIAKLWINQSAFTFNVNQFNSTREFINAVNLAVKQDEHVKGKIIMSRRVHNGLEKGIITFHRTDSRKEYAPDVYSITINNVFLLICGQRSLRDNTFDLGRGRGRNGVNRKVIELEDGDFDQSDLTNVSPLSICVLTSNLVKPVYIGDKKKKMLQLIHLASMKGSMYEPKIPTYHPVADQVPSLQFKLQSLDGQELDLSSEKHVLITLNFTVI